MNVVLLPRSPPNHCCHVYPPTTVAQLQEVRLTSYLRVDGFQTLADTAVYVCDFIKDKFSFARFQDFALHSKFASE